MSQLSSNWLDVFDQFGPTALALRHFDEASGVGRVGRPHHQHEIAAMGYGAHGVLAILRGVTDVVRVGPVDVGKARAQGLDDLGRLVDRQRRLRQVRQRPSRDRDPGVATSSTAGHDANVLGGFAERPLDLFVIGVPDKDEVVVLRGEAARLDMHFGTSGQVASMTVRSSRAVASLRT